METNNTETFWDHLSILRTSILRCAIVVLVFSVLAFCCKEILFEGIIFAPTREDFATFRLLRQISEWLGLGDEPLQINPIKIINTQLQAQVFIHMDMAFWVGLAISIPYISIEIWRFVSPALYSHERIFASKAMICGGLLFYLGMFISYFLIFPLSVNFLANYQVSGQIENMIDLDSYTGMLTALCLGLGLVFEMPVIAYLLARIGILTYSFISSHRRHSIVAVLILAAVITPTTDIFTMLITALPLQLIYELSILVVKKADRKRQEQSADVVLSADGVLPADGE